MAYSLQSLLAGPQAYVEHDEHETGQYVFLLGPVPLGALAYWSGTVRDQLGITFNGLQMQLPPAFFAQALPVKVQIQGGNSLGHKDVLQWMMACCGNNVITLINDYLQSRSRCIFAFTSIRILQVTSQEYLIPVFLSQLTHQTLSAEELTQVISGSKSAILPEFRNEVLNTFARTFIKGQVSEVERYFWHARLNMELDRSVLQAIRIHRIAGPNPTVQVAESAWMNKSGAEFAMLVNLAATWGVVQFPAMPPMQPMGPMPHVQVMPQQPPVAYMQGAPQQHPMAYMPAMHQQPVSHQQYHPVHNWVLPIGPDPGQHTGAVFNNDRPSPSPPPVIHRPRERPSPSPPRVIRRQQNQTTANRSASPPPPRPRSQTPHPFMHPALHPGFQAGVNTIPGEDWIGENVNDWNGQERHNSTQGESGHVSFGPLRDGSRERSRSTQPWSRNPSYEAAKPGEKELGRQKIGPNEYVHRFETPDGRIRSVSKGAGFRTEAWHSK